MKTHSTRILAVATMISTSALMAQAPKGPALRAVNQTFYTDRTELFAEWRPVVLGQATRFTAHLTKLGSTFHAYTAAKVSLALTVDNTVVESKTETPERPGVFRLPFTATKAGKGRIAIEVAADGQVEKFVIDDVAVYASTDEALAKQGGPPESGLISFAKEASWDMDFATAPAGKSMTFPASAVIQDQGQSYIFVQHTPERFELRPVRADTDRGGLLRVSSGLKEGERVVVRGADRMPRK